MHLVELVNYEIVPTQECFLIRPIRQLFNADRSKNKEKFMQQLSVIYFMADPRSSYGYMTDDNERLEAIKIQEGLPKNYTISKELQLAIDTYRKLTTTISSQLLEDTYVAIDKLRKFLRNIDLYAVDDKGKPLYTINNITQAIKQIPQLSKDLLEAEKIVSKEIEEQGRARGGNNKTLFEDGISF